MDRKPRTVQVFEPLRSDYVFRTGMGGGPA